MIVSANAWRVFSSLPIFWYLYKYGLYSAYINLLSCWFLTVLSTIPSSSVSLSVDSDLCILASLNLKWIGTWWLLQAVMNQCCIWREYDQCWQRWQVWDMIGDDIDGEAPVLLIFSGSLLFQLQKFRVVVYFPALKLLKMGSHEELSRILEDFSRILGNRQLLNLELKLLMLSCSLLLDPAELS